MVDIFIRYRKYINYKLVLKPKYDEIIITFENSFK